MDKRNYLHHLASITNLPAEPIPGMPVVEIVGDGRVLIENHYGVIEYDRNNIRVKVAFGELRVCGCGLELSQMTKHQLVVFGQIQGVSIIK